MPIIEYLTMFILLINIHIFSVVNINIIPLLTDFVRGNMCFDRSENQLEVVMSKNSREGPKTPNKRTNKQINHHIVFWTAQ